MFDKIWTQERAAYDRSSWRKRLRSVSKKEEYAREKRQEEGEDEGEGERVSLLVPGTGHLAERSFIIVSIPPVALLERRRIHSRGSWIFD